MFTLHRGSAILANLGALLRILSLVVWSTTPTKRGLFLCLSNFPRRDINLMSSSTLTLMSMSFKRSCSCCSSSATPVKTFGTVPERQLSSWALRRENMHLTRGTVVRRILVEKEGHNNNNNRIRQRVHVIGFAGEKSVSVRTVIRFTGKNHVSVGAIIEFY